ncbi:hypothetical protein Hamer_G007083 [Homarus americanus]|uniref:Uncharacterized protein n=1 Tax=Homarus americanus TaxID=6706 RepID=A0A8J5MVU8_HOMAM|nr:hypothetical protein Hamer_G007083 [Homarus americanus]
MWHLINKVVKKKFFSALHHSPEEYAQDLVGTWSGQYQAVISRSTFTRPSPPIQISTPPASWRRC